MSPIRIEQRNDFEWYTDLIPTKILGQYFGNVDCTRQNWEAKIQMINGIIGAWRHWELSIKGKALVINGLLTSTLWYNVMSLPVPSWAISQIERVISDFFWSYKRHLVNILALPLNSGGFNIPRLQTKIEAFRLLPYEDFCQMKTHTGNTLWHISHIRLCKLNLVLGYSPRQIDRDIPTFHKELLFAREKHKHLRIRTHLPEKLPDILNEPLFKNELVTVDDQPLLPADWIAAGLTQVKDIC